MSFMRAVVLITDFKAHSSLLLADILHGHILASPVYKNITLQLHNVVTLKLERGVKSRNIADLVDISSLSCSADLNKETKESGGGNER